MQQLAILGSGGNALDLLDVIDSINAREPSFDVVGVLDDARVPGTRWLGFEVLGGIAAAVEQVSASCLFASSIWNTGTARQLDDILARTAVPAERFATLVHAGAHVSTRARLGRGVVINAGASVAGNVELADFVSIGPGCIVGHDTTIDSYSMLAAGSLVGGEVTVGRHCYIGSGALVRQRQVLADGALVGMGAVVVDDVDASATVVGVPATRLQRTRSSGQHNMNTECLD